METAENKNLVSGLKGTCTFVQIFVLCCFLFFRWDIIFLFTILNLISLLSALNFGEKKKVHFTKEFLAGSALMFPKSTFLFYHGSVSDANRPATLRPRDREAREQPPQHLRPLDSLDLRRRPHHGGKLPGSHTDHQREQRRVVSWLLVGN